MHPLLENVFETKQFLNSRNELVAINSETPKGQCQFLQDLVREGRYTRTLEIGFAYGTSTLAIVEEVARQNGSHTVIDKFQMESWGGNGLDLIDQAGLSKHLEFIDTYCYEALPQLMQAGRRFDFAYVDSTKQLDWLLVDFFFIDKLLNIGGMVVFDDVSYPSIRKLLRYLSRFPAYKVHSQYPASQPEKGLRKMAGWLRAFPKAARVLRPEILVPDHALGLNSNCIALLKTAEDQRRWDWHVDF